MSNFYSHLIYFHDNFIVLIMKIKLKLHLPLKAHEKTVNLSRVKKAVGVLSNSIMSQSVFFSLTESSVLPVTGPWVSTQRRGLPDIVVR